MAQELILTTAAVITALGVIAGSLFAIYRVARRIGDAIGVDKNGRTISDRLDRVEHQLWENGGSSLADRVNTIEAHSIKTTTELTLIKDFLIPNMPVEPAKTRRSKKADIKVNSQPLSSIIIMTDLTEGFRYVPIRTLTISV